MAFQLGLISRVPWGLALVVWIGACRPALGDRSSEEPSAPSYPYPGFPIAQKIRLAAGAEHTCAVIPTGSVLCWGANEWGQLGHGTQQESQDRPTPMLGIDDAVAVSAGRGHTCVLRRSGEVWCAGLLSPERSMTDRLATTPSFVGIRGAWRIASAEHHACAQTKYGTVQCFGGRYRTTHETTISGDPGHIELHASIVAVDVGGTLGSDQIVMLPTHGCVVQDTDSIISCWAHPGDPVALGPVASPMAREVSRNQWMVFGAQIACRGLADGAPIECGPVDGLDGTVALEPVVTLPEGRYGAMAAGGSVRGGGSVCASIRREGHSEPDVACWTEELPNVNSSARGFGLRWVPGTTNLTGLVVGDYHACGLDPDQGDWGRVRCWGSNVRGQLGVDRHAVATEPVTVVGLERGAQALSAGPRFACALRSSGMVACWGDDGLRGPPPCSKEVRDVPELGHAVAIDVGRQEICALGTDGIVRCVGDQGLGTSTLRTVVLPESATAIALGSERSCAVHGSGRVSCWWGDLGSGLGRSGEPVALPFSEPVRALAVDDLVCGLLQGGGVECSIWPNISIVRLDVPNATDVWVHRQTACVKTTGDRDAQCLRSVGNLFIAEKNDAVWPELREARLGSTSSVGLGFSCSIDTQGGVRCWGDNELGQLGSGEGLFRAEAVAVGSTL